MKKFREANADLYEVSRDEKLAHDLALITEKGEDICAIPPDQLKSKLMKDRHKKMCKGLFNSLDEADMQNLIVHIQDITKDMIKALKKNDQRTLDGLYKNLGNIIK